jgi:hypothetical protein
MVRTYLGTALAVACLGTFTSNSLADGTYLPTKDTFFREQGSVAGNDSVVFGASATNRGARDINLAFYLSDFDRAAIIADVRAISGNTLNPLTLADMATVQLHWMVKANLSAEGESVAQNQGYLDAAYSVSTLQTKTPNWTETNSTNNWVNWTGDALTSTRWQDLSSADIVPSGTSGAINNKWHQRIDQADPLTVWGGTAPADGSDLPHRDWVLSDALALDFLANPDVAGLAFIGDTNNSKNIEFWSREAANVADRPFLVVTSAAVPEPASLGLLSIGGLMLLRRRR